MDYPIVVGFRRAKETNKIKPTKMAHRRCAEDATSYRRGFLTARRDLRGRKN
ncbi:MAG: hypothetical protein ACQCN4_03660 [Candidatus Bathyarchaeia archaeon]